MGAVDARKARDGVNSFFGKNSSANFSRWENFREEFPEPTRTDRYRRSVSPRPMAMRIKSAVWLTPSFSLMRLKVLATVL